MFFGNVCLAGVFHRASCLIQMPWACSEVWYHIALGLNCCPVSPSGLADGQWHTHGVGVPFSSDLFEQICKQVWKKDDCKITAEQLVWTCLVVRYFADILYFRVRVA